MLLATPACAAQDNATSTAPSTVAATAVTGEITSAANDAASQEAWMQAGEYSQENVAISYAVYGRTSRYSNDRIAQELNALFYERELDEDEVRVWQANPEQVGVGISIYVDGVMIHENVMGLSETVEFIPRAVELYQEHAPGMRERLEEERRSRTVTSAALNLDGAN